MSDSNDKNPQRLSCLDQFMIEEILAGEAEDTDSSAVGKLLSNLDRAEINIRKNRLQSLRAEIDYERANPRALTIDVDRMRDKLRAAANDPDIKMTMAARNSIDDTGDGDIQSLLEDLAELDLDSGNESK